MEKQWTLEEWARYAVLKARVPCKGTLNRPIQNEGEKRVDLIPIEVWKVIPEAGALVSEGHRVFVVRDINGINVCDVQEECSG